MVEFGSHLSVKSNPLRFSIPRKQSVQVHLAACWRKRHEAAIAHIRGLSLTLHDSGLNIMKCLRCELSLYWCVGQNQEPPRISACFAKNRKIEEDRRRCKKMEEDKRRWKKMEEQELHHASPVKRGLHNTICGQKLLQVQRHSPGNQACKTLYFDFGNQSIPIRWK